MIDDRTRQQMGDYLDERLDDEGRRDFEKRLNNEPGLSGELAAARRAREALRSGDEELSPDFYARTVERFESERSPGGRLPFGLTWSSAGLAAATIVAAAIFIPMALRDEIRETPSVPKSTVEREISKLEGDVGATTDATKDVFGGVGGFDAKEQEIETTAREQDRPTDAEAGRLDAVAPLKKAKQDQPDTPVGQASRVETLKTRDGIVGEFEESAVPANVAVEDDRDEGERKAAALEQRAEEPGPVMVEELVAVRARTDAEATATPAAERQKRSNEVAESALPVADPEESALEERIATGKPATATTLPAGAVAAGTVELRSAANLQTFFNDSNAPARKAAANANLHAGARAITDGRLLVIGARPGLDACSELDVEATARSWEVSFVDGLSATGTVSCAIELPDDGREVRFLGQRVDG